MIFFDLDIIIVNDASATANLMCDERSRFLRHDNGN